MKERPGTVHWNEVNTHDPEAAARFYEAMFGWEIRVIDMGEEPPYRCCFDNGKPVAGIFHLAGPQFEGMPAHWLTYFAVESIDRAVEAVVKTGGTVARAPFETPAGRMAVICDPTGAYSALIQPTAQYQGDCAED